MFDPKNFPPSQMISTGDVELEIFQAGTENAGNPIVLCHGWPELAFSWRFQITALAEAGYHVIAVNQRGYGKSSCPKEVSKYDILHLTDDLVGVLVHFGYKDAIFVGHDWGAMVVWNMAMLFPDRVQKIINLALPYQPRGDRPWLEGMEEFFGQDHYFVHFNKKPGVADRILEDNTVRFLQNLYRKNLPVSPPKPGMMMINLAEANTAEGDPLMSESEMAEFVTAFESSGFSGGIHWYRNLDRNWHLLAEVDPIIHHPTLMIYGERDLIPKFEKLTDFVPSADVISLDCGHWIPQEKPAETNQAILQWLGK